MEPQHGLDGPETNPKSIMVFPPQKDALATIGPKSINI